MKKIVISVMLLLTMLLICGNSYASSGSTVFIGEPIILDDYTDIEISYNKIDINEDTSEIKNEHIFTNTSDKTITRKATIKLEDSYSKLTINSLKIIVNGLEISKVDKDGDNYSFYFQILPNEGKKIDVSYKTDSNLQDAKIIKYTMDKLKGKEVKLFQLNIIMNKYDIPLVEKIWPGAYDFNNNTVSVEYFNFNVNNLTSKIIMQKETYKSAKYGENAEVYNERDLYIIENAKDLIDNGVVIKGNGGTRGQEVYSNSGKKLDYENRLDGNYNGIAKTIYYYIYGIQLIKENKQYLDNGNEEKMSDLNWLIDYSSQCCLTNYILSNGDAEGIVTYIDGDRCYRTPGKKVAINYYETEQNKTLYIYKNLDNSGHQVEARNDYVIRSEWDILRTNEDANVYKYDYQPIFVNSDIDGNKIDITEKEILDFVNMINVDVYLRNVIYDKRNEDDYITAGYYNDKDKEILDFYTDRTITIKEYEKSLAEATNETERERYQEWLEREKAHFKYRKFDNEDVVNYSKVVTIANCVAQLGQENGKYTIHTSGNCENIYAATECEAAKNIKQKNAENNEAIKNEIVRKINSTIITPDTKEDEIKVSEVKNDIENKDEDSKYVPLYVMIILLVVFIIILIILIILRRKSNGKEGK